MLELKSEKKINLSSFLFKFRMKLYFKTKESSSRKIIKFMKYRKIGITLKKIIIFYKQKAKIVLRGLENNKKVVNYHLKQIENLFNFYLISSSKISFPSHFSFNQKKGAQKIVGNYIKNRPIDIIIPIGLFVMLEYVMLFQPQHRLLLTGL